MPHGKATRYPTWSWYSPLFTWVPGHHHFLQRTYRKGLGEICFFSILSITILDINDEYSEQLPDFYNTCVSIFLSVFFCTATGSCPGSRRKLQVDRYTKPPGRRTLNQRMSLFSPIFLRSWIKLAGLLSNCLLLAMNKKRTSLL